MRIGFLTAALVLLSGATMMGQVAKSALPPLEPLAPVTYTVEKALTGEEFGTCVNTSIYRGPLTPDYPTTGEELSKHDRMIGVYLKVTVVHVVPWTGPDGGYRVFLGMSDKDGQQYHALTWVRWINVTHAVLMDEVMNGIEVHKGAAGYSMVDIGMSDSEVLCRLGGPDTINQYDDDEQDIYEDGHLIVYIDGQTHKITHIQRFGD